MQVIVVPCLRDNFAYLIRAEGSDAAAVVDPSEAAPVQAALEEHGLRLHAILNTHHHWDHVGGNEALLKARSGVRVFGHASDEGRIFGQTDFLEHEQSFELLGLSFQALHIPGHTTGAVAYVVEGAVFTGDTLFAAGCGRLFEGTPAMMYESLNQKLGALPDDTRVYFGHEYTLNNLRFAAHVEPDNSAVSERAARVRKGLDVGQPSTPCTLAEERATNPFMRCDSPGVLAHLATKAGTSPVDVLAALRAEKDSF
ncbi:MAG: hydroxyacylglutathione hydrolase [Polyangiaceae bacterium]